MRVVSLVVKSSLIGLVLGILTVLLAGMKQREADAWFDEDFEAKARAVNEGDLEFLAEAPLKTPPLLHNELTITPQSLEDGWVGLIQCHQKLDAVPDAQVLYHPQRTRNIQIISFQNIEQAWVEKSSVQLKNIRRDASLCVRAEVKSLYSNFDGSYSMRNGPFLRKFLDGYYPMRVTMDVNLPAEKLTFEAITPQEQKGFSVRYDKHSIRIEALFVGELEIEVYFADMRTHG